MTKPLLGTANLLAGQAVSLAEAFLDGRKRAEIVCDKTIYLFADLRRLKQSQVEFLTSSLIDAANVLTVALRNASNRQSTDPLDSARADRWRELLPPLIEHVRREALKLNEEGHFA